MSDATDTIFFRAREISDSDERAAYLDDACRDAPELRARVEAMLGDEAGAEAWLGDTISDEEMQTTVAMGSTDPGGGTERPGQVIGRYVLMEKLGEGGFGSVWMAEQTEPVTRRVALKIIKQGMDTQEVIARFEAERQALAMMDHPNIARVFDAGATETGRPFFVMELVTGVTVTEFCNERQFDTRRRLALFRDICSAVNHAHQKGIIHRDLKPSNVLVALQGDEPVVKVIDFGIAKATESELTEATLLTRIDQMIGTPAYMSPEQAASGSIDIDTRADIYALGVLLYELLSGKPPFDPKSLLSAGYDEMRRIILEVEPPRPSLRCSTADAGERSRITATHGTDTQRLERTLKGELDWIVMKAIEKDRSRRYATANDLAADIGRYLANEPVSAAAPSVGYRLNKFARRNKVALGVAATFALVLLAATGISTGQAIRAIRAERQVSGLLDESRIRERKLSETVDLLTESTEELESHMRRFIIGTWDFQFELDEERGKREMGESEWPLYEQLFTSSLGDFSSQLQFKEDSTALGATIVPPLLQAFTPHETKKQLQDGHWELIKQQGKRTTVKVTSRGLGGVRQSTEFTVTVLNSDTLQMEDVRFEDLPVKPFIFKRVQEETN